MTVYYSVTESWEYPEAILRSANHKQEWTCKLTTKSIKLSWFYVKIRNLEKSATRLSSVIKSMQVGFPWDLGRETKKKVGQEMPRKMSNEFQTGKQLRPVICIIKGGKWCAVKWNVINHWKHGKLKTNNRQSNSWPLKEVMRLLAKN